MSTTKRLTRHEIKEPDQVITSADHAIEYTRQNPQRIVAITVAAAVVILAALGTVRWREGRATKDSDALAKLFEIYRRPVASEPGSTRPGIEPFVDAAARDNAILEATDAFLRERHSAVTTRAAKLLQAEALSRRGRHEDAAKLFGEVAGDSPADVLAGAAVLGRASAQADSGQAELAVAELRRLASAGRPATPKPLLLERAAIISENSGKTEEALALYRLIAEDKSATTGILARAESKVTELELEVKDTSPTASEGTSEPTATAAPAATTEGP